MSPRKLASSCSWFARKSRTAVRGPSSRAASSWRLVLSGSSAKRRSAASRYGSSWTSWSSSPSVTARHASRPAATVSSSRGMRSGQSALERRLFHPAEIVAGLEGVRRLLLPEPAPEPGGAAAGRRGRARTRRTTRSARSSSSSRRASSDSIAAASPQPWSARNCERTRRDSGGSNASGPTRQCVVPRDDDPLDRGLPQRAGGRLAVRDMERLPTGSRPPRAM